jgi:hypothetical protein
VARAIRSRHRGPHGSAAPRPHREHTDQLVEDFERWDVEASYYSRWLEVLPELKIRVDEAIDRYERIRTMASTGG